LQRNDGAATALYSMQIVCSLRSCQMRNLRKTQDVCRSFETKPLTIKHLSQVSNRQRHVSVHLTRIMHYLSMYILRHDRNKQSISDLTFPSALPTDSGK